MPYWNSLFTDQSAWLERVNRQLSVNEEISLYIHLPFCEELCTYCGCNKRITKQHSVEQPYIEAVLSEWSIYIKSLARRPKIRELHLGGGTPTFFSPDMLGRLVDEIIKHADLAENHSFSFEAHPNSTTLDHLSILAARGFNRLSIGVQDFNNEILGLINRRQTEKDVERTVNYARQTGYKSINFDLIYGLPKQTRNDIVRNVVKVQQFKPERIAFYSYAHVPWKSKGQRAYDEKDLPQGKQKWNLYEIGRDLLQSSGYVDIGLDHFALPSDELYKAFLQGKLNRNFMGYTTSISPVTIALGCSGIGDSWDAYVQNEKKVENYQRIVLEEKRLPIVNGYHLEPEDKIVRRHILNLMCQGYTDWKAPELRCIALNRAIEQWNDMAIDGIIIRDPYKVSLTDKGKPFLRNICLPLDDHYWREQPISKTFSKAI